MRTSNNQITKKDLMSIYIRSLSLEYSWNYERQQHMGTVLQCCLQSSGYMRKGKLR